VASRIVGRKRLSGGDLQIHTLIIKQRNGRGTVIIPADVAKMRELRKRLASALTAIRDVCDGIPGCITTTDSSDTRFRVAEAMLAELCQSIDRQIPAGGQDMSPVEQIIATVAHQWQITFDAVSNGVCLLDREMRIVRANKALVQLIGLPSEQLSGMPCWKLIHGTGQPHPDCPALRMLESRRPESAEIRVRDRWFHVSVDPIFSAAGELDGAVHVVRDITERRTTLDRLKRNEMLLADAQRLAHIGSFQIEEEAGTVGWSREMHHIFEIPEFWPARSFSEISAWVHPADVPCLNEAIAGIRDTVGEKSIDFRVLLPSGTQKNLRCIMQALRDEQGRATGICGTIQDRTAEVKHTEELERAERRLALLLDMANQQYSTEQELFEWALESIVVLTDSTGGYLHLYDENDQNITLTAWSSFVREQCRSAEGVHYPLANAGIWADSIRLRSVVVHNDYNAIADKRGLPEGHFPLKRHLGVPVFDGAVIVAAAGVSNKETPYEDSDIQQIQIFMNDMWKIIARKRAERRLAESESAFRSLFDTSLDGVFRISSSLVIERANPALARIFGYDSPGILIGRSIVDFWHNPLERELYLDALKQKGAVQSYPFEAIDATGKTKHLEVTANLVRNAAGEYIASEGILRDVTDQKYMAKQLQHAQKMEAVGRLAGGIAHDFNNILSAIVGFASLPLMSGALGSTERNTLEQIISLTDRASMLTKGLLAFSRKQEMSMKPLELNGVVTIAVKLLGRLIGEDVKLVVRQTSIPLPVHADAGQIEQVLMNLATNARDAMPEGGVLTIESEKVALAENDLEGLSQGDYAVIRVKDTGLGIAPEHLPHIFEPFYTTKESEKGTGLGLASVYGIMQQHGGIVNVESAEGAGTTFFLYLPIHVSADEVMHEQSTIQVVGGSETILLVEDDDTLRRIASRLIAAHGYTVLEARNGSEAIGIVESGAQKIDLILSDMVMPEVGGLEIWRIVHERYPSIRILFMSGYLGDESKRSIIQKLGLTCITKPFEPRQILSAVRKELDRA